MDIQESLISDIYTTLIGDSDLQTAMGGTVRVYLEGEVPADTEFPYLVHKLDLSISGEWNPVMRSTYTLSIWSNTSTLSEIFGIREKVMALLDNLEDSTAETTEYWMWIQTEGMIPREDVRNARHYVMQFNLKHLRDAQVGVLLKR